VASKTAPTAQKSGPARTYDEFKEFEGQRYTGMKIGRRHKWYYDKGTWTEKKVTPDQWVIEYAVTKRRAGKAPEGSGVPVGTQYHWYILAHQNVTKLNANDYSTSMMGFKFKLAHKRADKETWSASSSAQRRKLIQILEKVIHDLKHPVPGLSALPATSLDGKPSTARPRRRRTTRARVAATV
jgi:hypothetical protein